MIGRLECDCGARVPAPMAPTEHDSVQCWRCQQVWVGVLDGCGGHWERQGHLCREPGESDASFRARISKHLMESRR